MAFDQRWRAVLLFGMPGSGKGTQGKAIGGVPGFLHIATGDIFRNLDQLGDIGKEVASYSASGRLVPDELTIEIWRNHMRIQMETGRFKPKEQCIVLDGIPRTRQQAECIDDDVRVLRIFNLNLRNEEIAVDRIRSRALKEGRVDDADENVIRSRLATFRRETAQTLSHYSNDLVHEIDAAKPPIEVLATLAGDLARIAGRDSP